MSSAPLLSRPSPAGAVPRLTLPRLDVARLGPATIFCAWALLAAFLISGHEAWRDEVRALSFAIDPPSWPAMLSGLRGEGHPALWYVLLRAGHELTGSLLVLPVTAALAAGAGVAFFLWRAPFRPAFKLLVACSAFLAVEYTVVARNYGISLLPFFVFAAFYESWRRGGVGLGLTLAVLANTNVHSALLVAALLGFWFLDTIAETGPRPSRLLAVWAGNAAIACIGIGVAAFIVRGPLNDAITSDMPKGSLADAAFAVVHPGAAFQALAPALPPVAITALLFGSLLALGRRPALLLAGFAGLSALAVLFTIGFPAQYRHTAIFLVFLLVLFWIAEARGGPHEPAHVPAWRRIGRVCLVAVLAVQVGLTLGAVTAKVSGRPWSSSAAAAAFLRAQPGLADAILVAEPDFYVEPFRYHGAHRTFLLREERFGRAVNFTRAARLDLSLGDVLASAQRLKRETGQEVVILVPTELRLDPAAPASVFGSGYNWTFRTSPADVAAFLAGTERLAAFEGSVTGEDYVLFRAR